MSSTGTEAPLNLLCVLGTRPEAIKLAPVILELRRRALEGGLPAAIRTRVCVTGQHRENAGAVNPYGDGLAAERIVTALLEADGRGGRREPARSGSAIPDASPAPT